MDRYDLIDATIAHVQDLKRQLEEGKAMADKQAAESPQVAAFNRLYTDVIELCEAERQGAPSELARLWSIAITEAQGAQMWAVKAATWREG